MNLQFLSQQPKTSTPTTFIIPVLPENAASLDQLNQAYALDGFKNIRETLIQGKGKNTTVFKGNAEIQTFILFNAEAETQHHINQSCIEILKSNAEYIFGNVCVDLRFIATDHSVDISSAIFRGIFLSSHQVGKYKTINNAEQKVIDNLSIISKEDLPQLETKFNRALAAAETIKSCMTLVNEPSNHKSPQDMADWMLKSGAANGFDVEVLDKKMLEAQGFHALLSVNRGSEEPARCIIARYTGNASSTAPSIGLVGKGVTFDTGGMSIKPSNNMHYMKSDMGGAAAVMGTIELVAKLKLPVNVFGIIPCTDNSVDSLATKPGDVIKSYKGSTIEIIDTDAEGRLVLADGLNYAVSQLKPDFLVDLATLTGSVVRALGTHAAGLMTKSEFMADTLSKAADISGDRLWRLPLWDDYDQYMNSDIADIKNLSDKPMAGAVTAGKFLEHFTDEHPNWAHLDIAGTAFGPSPFSKGYSASGFGILLLLSWIEIVSQNKIS